MLVTRFARAQPLAVLLWLSRFRETMKDDHYV